MTQLKRSFTVTFDKELAEAIYAHMVANELASPSETVRYLCRVALASTPEHGMVNASRVAAYNEVRQWAISELQQALASIHNRLRESMLMQGGR